MGHEPNTTPGGWGALDSLVEALTQSHHAVAAAQAAESRLLAAAVDLVLARVAEDRLRGLRRSAADLPLREVSAEVGTALRLSDRTVQRRMGDASALVSDFPQTLTAWEKGVIDSGHVAAILDAGVPLSDAHRERFEALALEVARTETAGRLQGIARSLAAQIDPEGAGRRIRERQYDRSVRVIDLDDGMARLLADLPATLAHAIHDRLTRMAYAVRDEGAVADDGHTREGNADAARASGRAADMNPDAAADDAEDDDVFTTAPRPSAPADGGGGAGAGVGDGRAGAATAHDGRTIDQLRADLLSDLLLGGAPVAHGDGLEAITGHVQITVPVLTLAGLKNEPALLAGHGPIDADTARTLAGTARGWDRVLTHPYTGEVLAVDRYRPGEELKRHLRARDEHCRFPGCRRPARGCDIDHTQDAALGGETCAHNLCHLCRRHHTLKHATAWTVRQRSGGVIEWRSPTGRRYHDRPPAVVRFVPGDVDPPPF